MTDEVASRFEDEIYITHGTERNLIFLTKGQFNELVNGLETADKIKGQSFFAVQKCEKSYGGGVNIPQHLIEYFFDFSRDQEELVYIEIEEVYQLYGKNGYVMFTYTTEDVKQNDQINRKK